LEKRASFVRFIRLAATSLLALVLFSLAACGSRSSDSSAGDKPLIKIGYLPITHAGPLYIEEETKGGDYDGFRLQLIKFGSWPDLMDALNAGKIDGASVLMELAMRAKEQGIDLKAVALGHKDGNVVVVANDIGKVQDLKGKSFAIPSAFSTHNILLYQMLKKAGMAYGDVKAVELAPAEMPAALASGRIAGYVVAEPFGAKSVVIRKGKVLYQSQDLWDDSVDCGLVLRGDLIRKQPEAVQAFVAAYAEAGHKAETKDAEVKQNFKKYMNLNDDELNLSLQWIKYDDLKIGKEPYEQLRSYLKEMGLSDNPPAYEDFVDPSFMDKVK